MTAQEPPRALQARTPLLRVLAGARGGREGVNHAVRHSQLIVSAFVFLFPLKMSCILITA